MGLPDIHRTSTKVFKLFCQQKHCQLVLKGPETERNEGRLSDFKDSAGRKRADRITPLQICAMLLGKGRTTPRAVQQEEAEAREMHPGAGAEDACWGPGADQPQRMIRP